MESGLAAMAFDNRSAIYDVIEVAMSEQQKIDPIVCESGVRPLRRVEKDSACRRLIVKAIGVEHTAGIGFEPIHEKMVREMMSRFDFRGSLCKLLTFTI